MSRIWATSSRARGVPTARQPVQLGIQLGSEPDPGPAGAQGHQLGVVGDVGDAKDVLDELPILVEAQRELDVIPAETLKPAEEVLVVELHRLAAKRRKAWGDQGWWSKDVPRTATELASVVG